MTTKSRRYKCLQVLLNAAVLIGLLAWVTVMLLVWIGFIAFCVKAAYYLGWLP